MFKNGDKIVVSNIGLITYGEKGIVLNVYEAGKVRVSLDKDGIILVYLASNITKIEESNREDNKGRYILWNPSAKTPPQKTHDSYEEAERIAKIMAERNPGNKFYIMKAEAVAQTSQVSVEKLY